MIRRIKVFVQKREQAGKRKKQYLITGVLLVALTGTLAMLYTRAAAPAVSIQPETGTRTANAVVVSDAAASGASAVAFTALRLYAMQPFSPTSIWNIPLHSGVVYSAPSDPRNGWTQRIAGTATMNYGANWNLAIWQAKTDSPNVTIMANRDIGYPVWPAAGATHKVPADGVVPGPKDASGNYTIEYDGWVTIISPDGRNAIELYKAVWLEPGKTLRAAYAYTYPLDGEDMRPSGAHKASNFSYLGGTVRKWEMSSTAPPATRIRHAISMSLPRGELKAPFVWPATGQDYGWETDYDGAVPMGTNFALPWNFDIESPTLALSPEGKALAYALRNYGAWVGDASGNATIYAEMNSPAAAGDAYRLAWKKLIPYLVAVDGRSASLPGGSGSPRVPLIGPGTFGPIP